MLQIGKDERKGKKISLVINASQDEVDQDPSKIWVRGGHVCTHGGTGGTLLGCCVI